jgi:LytS/YehU family sensor histidine kinase
LNEKKVLENHLRLLQAQIEPHFLFNTLTSIVSLGKKNPPKAKVMQTHLIDYLETTLAKTRSSMTTISQEIELLRSYLEIFKVRMGKRLSYTIVMDDALRSSAFPSMLIQPIIENSIKHGLEPKIEGGRIYIKVERMGEGTIRWTIEDTGLGMSDTVELGTGLSNLMERVELLYGRNGQVVFRQNHPSGLTVVLEVPYVYC